MAKARPKDMTADEFLVWCLDQEGRYEFVDGEIIALRPPARAPSRGMAGASTAHDRIVSNVSGTLFGHLKGHSCWPTTPETAVRTAIKRIRRPDVTIECAPPEQRGYEVRNPVATFEVLSPSTQRTDKLVKLPEYMRHPSLLTIVLIEPDVMDVLVYQRDENGEWQGSAHKTPEAEIEIAGTPAKLTLAEIYDGVPLTVRSHG